jgi:peptidoglycan/LPS O-acetylase OafA/YrhL
MNVIIGLSYSFFAISACVIFAILLDLFNCKKLNNILSFIGSISLEMYLFNIYLIQVFGHYIQDGAINLSSDYYHGFGIYSLIILFGIALSYLFRKLNNWIAAGILGNGKFNHGRISSPGQ